MDTCGFKDYYALLGVEKNADAGEIHKAYWRQARRCHPDKGGNNEAMAQITEAWGILSDPLKRERHDRLLASLQGERRNRVYKDVLRESQINAYKHARSWAEFEKIYLKAYDTFKWDLEHSDRNMKVIDPFAFRSAGESIIVWIYNCVTGEIFVVSRSPTMVDTHKPGGVAVFFILMISMTVGLGLGALFRILFG